MRTTFFAFLCMSLMALSINSSSQDMKPAQSDRPQGPDMVSGGQENNRNGQRAPTDKTKPSDAHQLRVEVSKTSQMAETLTGLKCDEDGNLYMHVDILGLAGVHKLSAKGEPLALFEAKSSRLAVSLARDFSLASNGVVYELISAREPSRYVFVYKPDGTLSSEIKLQAGFFFSPQRIAVFPSGALFVSGLEPDKDNADTFWPFQGIFSSDGTLLKEVDFADDEDIYDLAASGDKRVVLPTNSHSNIAVAGESIEAGADGNVYLMRRISPAILYAVAPGGSVRRFTVDPGDEDFLPSHMHISGNRIAILFRKELTGQQFLKVTDLEGHVQATYEDRLVNGVSELGPAFACYNANSETFTFLSTMEDGKLGIKTAQP